MKARKVGVGKGGKKTTRIPIASGEDYCIVSYIIGLEPWASSDLGRIAKSRFELE